MNENLLKNEKLSSLMKVLESETERLSLLQKSLNTGPEGYVDKTLRLVVNRSLHRATDDIKRINLSASELPDDPDESLIDAFQAEIIEAVKEIKSLFSKIRYQK